MNVIAFSDTRPRGTRNTIRAGRARG